MIYNNYNKLIYGNEINRSNKSYDLLYDYMIQLDNIFKKKYKDDDTKKYFKIIKDKVNKTKYAYSIKIFNDEDFPFALSMYYNLKYHNTKYDIICFILNEPIYEKDFLNNTYLKINNLSEYSLNILTQLFDIVISTKINMLDNTKINKSNYLYNNSHYYYKYSNYDNLYFFFYDEYKKIICLNTCIINKNIDFIFDKYSDSVCSMDNLHINSKLGLTDTILLIIPKKYYIKKMLYILDNYKEITKDLYIITPIFMQILYYTIFPNWNKERFDIDIINYNYIRKPYIELTENKYMLDYYVDYFFSYSPNRYEDIKTKTKFNLNIINFEKWDLLVKRILEENPNYESIYNYIRTYRETLF